MRRVPLLLLAVPAVLLAADLFGSLGWNQARFEDACFAFAKYPERLPAFPVTPAMRALAVTQRKDAILAIGARAKAYYASEAFRTRWEASLGPAAPVVDRGAADQAEKQRAQSIAQLEAMLPMLPPAQQEKAKASIAKERARAGKQKTGSGAAGEPPSRDPNARIRQALQTVLAATEGVDHGAALTTMQGRKYFTNRAYEAKPEAWKMAFRAGREATGAARAYAQAWLAELR